MSSDKLAFVDLLRGIAILMVVTVHTAVVIVGLDDTLAGLLRYGQMGVQLFFVASAYTLALSYQRSAGSPTANRAFYLRRWFRIAPMYYVGILLYFGLRLAKARAEGQGWSNLEPYTAVNLLANALFVHGLYPPANNNIVPGGWSIGTEMLFYLIFPALYSAASRVWRRSGSAGVAGMVVAALALDALAQIIWAGHWRIDLANNSFPYLNLLNQLPVFLLGLLAYFRTLETVPGTHDRVGVGGGKDRALLVFLLAMSLGLWLLREPGWLNVLMPTVAGAAFCALLFVVRGSGLRCAAVERIGQLSYSIYVVHFLFAWYVAPRVVTMLGLGARPTLAWLLSLALVVAATTTLALLTERWIERPGIAAGARRIARMRAAPAR